MKELLEIILVTYNRKDFLKRTLEQLFSASSPVKNLSFTILDNKSTDGTYELIEEYAKRFPNIKHIVHNKNIGGAANVARAFEIATHKYLWVLCDDDSYDFSGWAEVEKNIKKERDIICVADYVFENKYPKEDITYQLLQLTFVPSGIYKTDLITDTVLANIYDMVYANFPQSCVSISAVNSSKKITVISKPIVFNGQNNVEVDASYFRGTVKQDIPAKRANFLWMWGYANLCALIKDTALREKCFRVPLSFKDIAISEKDFCSYITCCYFAKPELKAMFYDMMYCCDDDLKQKINKICKYQPHFIISSYRKGDNRILNIAGLKIRIWSKKWFSKKKNEKNALKK